MPSKGMQVRGEGGETIRTNLRIKFLHYHMRDTIVIIEYGNSPTPSSPA